MRRRHGFTIIELLVALALIIFIMLILTEAFSAGMETFRRLKAIGDMQERLRSTAMILRRDLAADHFEARRRLSDLNFWNDGYPSAGFFNLPQNSGSVGEGSDPDLQAQAPYNGYVIAPVREIYPGNANPQFFPMLYFSAKLRGNGRGDYFSANVPAGSPLLTQSTNNFGQASDGQYQEPGLNAFGSQWAEVLYALVPTGTSAGTNTPLYALYRCQFVVVPDNTNVNNQVAAGGITGYYEMSCWPNQNTLYFNTPHDLTNPANRVLNNAQANPNGPRGIAINRQNPALWSATLLLSDVVSFDVRALKYDLTPQPAQEPYFVDLTTNGAFDTADPKATNPNSNQGPPNYVIKGLQISIRIWDLKTLQTRQITVIQDL